MQRRADAAQSGTLYTANPDGARQQAALANPATTPETRALVEAADSMRFEEREGRGPRRKTFAEYETEADAILYFDAPAVREALEQGRLLATPGMMRAAMRLVDDAQMKAARSGKPEDAADAALVVQYYRDARAETARALGAGRDLVESPALRTKRLILESVYGIDPLATREIQKIKAAQEGEVTQARRRMEQAEAEAERMNRELDGYEAAIEEAEAERAGALRAVEQAQRRLSAIEATTAEAKVEAQQAQRQGDRLAQQRAELREQIAHQEGVAAELEAEIKDLEGEVARRGERLREERMRRNALNADFRRASERLRKAMERAAGDSAKRAAKAVRALSAVGVDVAEIASYGEGDGAALADAVEVVARAGTQATGAAKENLARVTKAAQQAQRSAADAEAALKANLAEAEAVRARLLAKMRAAGLDTSAVEGVRLSKGQGPHDVEFRQQHAAVQVIRDAEGQLLAPNGQVSKLTEDQYRTVRTQRYKGRVGDWESAAVRQFLDGAPVAHITGQEIGDFATLRVGGIKALVQAAMQHLELRLGAPASVQHPTLGSILVSKGAVNSSLSHGFGKAKYEALAALPDVLAAGRVLPMGKKESSDVEGFLVVAPVQAKGERIVLAALVRRNANSQGFYVHEAFLESDLKTSAHQKTPTPSTGTTAPAGATSRGAGAISSRLQKVYAPSSHEVSVTVDPQTGEPEVSEARLSRADARGDGQAGAAPDVPADLFGGDPDMEADYALLLNLAAEAQELRNALRRAQQAAERAEAQATGDGMSGDGMSGDGAPARPKARRKVKHPVLDVPVEAACPPCFPLLSPHSCSFVLTPAHLCSFVFIPAHSLPPPNGRFLRRPARIGIPSPSCAYPLRFHPSPRL